MLLGSQVPSGGNESPDAPPVPLMLSIRGDKVEVGSNERGWQSMGVVTRGAAKMMHHFEVGGQEASLEVQVRTPLTSLSPFNHLKIKGTAQCCDAQSTSCSCDPFPRIIPSTATSGLPDAEVGIF
jgi:hypothetical protein